MSDDETDPLQQILAKHETFHARLLREEASTLEGKKRKHGSSSKCTPISMHRKVEQERDNEEVEQVEEKNGNDGFRQKKRRSLPSRDETHLFDFSIENPFDGKLKDLACVRSLIADFPNVVFETPTSYCHYGYPYQKRTVFITTLPTFRPTPPCPKRPCAARQNGFKHGQQAARSSSAQKNSIPNGLVDELVDAWMRRVGKTALQFLIVDVFSGWGSVSSRIQTRHPRVHVFSNDIVDRSNINMTLDMRTFSLGSLLILAASRFWTDEDDLRRQSEHPDGILGWLRDEKIAVLLHISTPCETYSTNALARHRKRGTVEPKTQEAVTADAMNERIVAYLRRGLNFCV